MLKLDNLRRFLQNHHRSVALCFLTLLILTLFLEISYLMIPELLLHIPGFYLPWVVCLAAVAILWPISATIICLTWLTMWMLRPKLRKLSRTQRERKFADYIMRRLLMQLELAMLSMPKNFELQQLLHDPILTERYQLAKEAAYKAVQMFRRDAAILLLTSCPMCLMVLPEEEQLLAQGGYSRIELRVSKKYLRQLLYPAGKGPERL